MLDETGRSIVTALGNLASAVQPTNIYEDLAVSIPANGWTNSEPFTYTWTSSKVTPECGIEVGFQAAAKDTDIITLSYEKVAGGVQFTAPSKPSVAIPVTIRIINADAEYVVTTIDAEMVETDAISGASNVQQALGTLNSKIDDLIKFVNVGTDSISYTANVENNGSYDLTSKLPSGYTPVGVIQFNTGVSKTMVRRLILIYNALYWSITSPTTESNPLSVTIMCVKT